MLRISKPKAILDLYKIDPQLHDILDKGLVTRDSRGNVERNKQKTELSQVAQNRYNVVHCCCNYNK